MGLLSISSGLIHTAVVLWKSVDNADQTVESAYSKVRLLFSLFLANLRGRVDVDAATMATGVNQI